MTNLNYSQCCEQLRHKSLTWLVTGGAGFIGSHLVHQLLQLGQQVIVLDNFSTGHKKNLDQVLEQITTEKKPLLQLIEGDICDEHTCFSAVQNVDFVLHQAALGSVPRSIEDPLATHAVNVTGFVNILRAAQQSNVRRFVYASSSSVYGDSPHLPKQEQDKGALLSPYAVSKYTNELYAKVFHHAYGQQTIGLRYFNVFGPRQDPNGTYAAVIPRWVSSLLKQTPVVIYGDGLTTRDFCYIENVVQANLLAALTDNSAAYGQAFNVAVGERISLNELYEALVRLLGCQNVQPQYSEARSGDIRHSLADISLAKEVLNYAPTHHLFDGLNLTMNWYKEECYRNESSNQSLARNYK